MQALVKGLGALSSRVYKGREKGEVGIKGWSVKFRLSEGDFFTIFLAFNKVIKSLSLF